MNRIERMVVEMCPDGVEYCRLGELGEWVGGGTPSKTKAEYWVGGTVPWVTPKDMGAIQLSSSAVMITPLSLEQSALRFVEGPSIAVVWRSSILDRVLPVSKVPFGATFNQDMRVLIPCDKCDPSFVLHLLRSQDAHIRSSAMKTGGSVASIVTERFMNLNVPIPPIEIQREIVDILDSFTRLEAELEARKAQYAFYRDRLLSFDFEAGGTPMSCVKLLGGVFCWVGC